MVLLKVVQELSLGHRFSTLPFVMERQVPSIKCVLKLWKFPKAQCNDKVVNECLCRDAEAFSHHSKKKKKARLRPPESLVKSQIACVVKIVLSELQLEREPRSMSAHLHYLLFSLKFFDLFPFPLFHFIL